MSRKFRIAISGAGGFVGTHLMRQLRALGHEAVPLSRQAPPDEQKWIPFSLEGGVRKQDLRGYDALIHGAYDFRVFDPAESRRRNVTGSMRLFDAASEAGVERLLFISSLSAFSGCKSLYGKAKLAVEEHVARLGGCSVRLGFVHDGSHRGLSGGLRKLAGGLPVIPVPGSGRQVLFPLSAADLGPAFDVILERGPGGQVISLASPEPVFFSTLLRHFAREQGKSVVLVPFPWQPMWLGLKLLEAVGLRLGFRSDSLLSLVNQDPDPDFEPLRRLGLKPAGYEPDLGQPPKSPGKASTD